MLYFPIRLKGTSAEGSLLHKGAFLALSFANIAIIPIRTKKTGFFLEKTGLGKPLVISPLTLTKGNVFWIHRPK